MNSTEIIPSSSEATQARLVDSFFEAQLQRTDWREFLDHPERLNKREILDELASYEPVPPGSPHLMRIFVLQQMLRLALRHEKKLLLEGPHTCAACGTRPWDPVLCRCLTCEEENVQFPRTGNRGNCEYLMPRFDVGTNTWGLLYYNSHIDSDNPLLFWIVNGYATREEAIGALLPFHFCLEYLERAVQGANTEISDAADIIDLDEVFAFKLPLAPHEWRAHLRTKLAGIVADASVNYGWAINSGIRAYADTLDDRK